MKKTAVVYESKYGAAKAYAGWLAEDLACPLLERKKIRGEDLVPYETVVYGGGLYAGGVNGVDLLVKAFPLLREKNLVLFTCGLSDPQDPDNVSRIRGSLEKALPRELLEALTVFHLRGGMDCGKLGLVDRAMMAMFRKVLSKKDPGELSAEDRLMLEASGKAVDFVDRAALAPILEYVRGL